MIKRISYFADFGSPNRSYTGGYYFAKCLLQILRQFDIELAVFSASFKRVDRGISYVSGKEVRRIDLPSLGFGSPVAGLSWARQLKKELKKMPPQDLYVFDQPMTFLDFLPKTPAVAMFHGSDFVRWSDLSIFHPRSLIRDLFWRKLFLNRISLKFLKREGCVPLFNSKDTLVRLARDFGVPAEPLRKYVTYLPLETGNFKRDDKERKSMRNFYGIKENDVAIITLSNINPVKRPERLLPIISMISESGYGARVKFLLIGRGKIEEIADTIAGKTPAFSGNILKIKEVAHEDLYKFYSAADIGLSTSERESFGYFVAEGMSAELPFVAYRGGAMDEVISHRTTGFIADSEKDALNFLETLIKDDDARRRMGLAGRRRAEENFSMDAFKNRFIDILNSEFGRISA